MRKTMAMRRLEQAGLGYEARHYPATVRDAAEVADALGLPAARMYKTLVVERTRGRPLLALVPADRSLDPRALAAAMGEKKLSLASQRDAERLTGLRVGGISPLAVRHGAFDVAIDASAVAEPKAGERPFAEGEVESDQMWLSSGQRGTSLGLSATELVDLLGATVARITR
jgi:Cys-tRNA(Pro)/Cys-tRNA(Cys) deacylase